MSSTQPTTPIPEIFTSPISSPPSERLASTAIDQNGTPAIQREGDTVHDSSFAYELSPKRPISPSVARLRTSSASEGRDSSYFVHRGSHSVPRHTRTTTPSDTLSTPMTLSPGRSSGGSSDTCRSLGSNSSGEFLTPPCSQPDVDLPPYKAASVGDSSLTMAKLRRVSTAPNKNLEKSRRKHRMQRHKHKVNARKRKHHSEWAHAGCQTVPTASGEDKYVCQGSAGQHTPKAARRGEVDIYGSVSCSLKSSSVSDAGLIVTRRWSSVEVGTHQIQLPPTLPTSPNPAPLPAELQAMLPTSSPDKRHRSSTFTRGAIDHDIIRTIRDTLTNHEVPINDVEIPSSITLRRASTAELSGLTTLVPTPAYDSVARTPKAQFPEESTQPSTAYIITRRDIDSITELVQANIKKNYRPHNRLDMNSPARQPSQDFHPPKVDVKIGSNSSPKPRFSNMKPELSLAPEAVNFLQVQPRSFRKSKPSPTKSIHEIIWQGSSSPGSPSSVTDEDEQAALSRSTTSSRRGVADTASRQKESHAPALHSLDADKGDAFDPHNANASINEWSWRCPPSDISVVITSSESESSEVTPSTEIPPKLQSRRPARPTISSRRSDSKLHHRHKPRPPTRATTVSKPSLTDVVSFPPLPSRATNDWFSPLPPVDTPSLETPRSLYDLGLDVNYGPQGSTTASVKTVTPQTSWVRTAESSTKVSRNSSIEFDPLYAIRRKSVVKSHPKASPRIGESSAVGSAIGSSSGARRKSSVPGVRRVRTIDNKHKVERTGTWNRIRPPSICPPVKSPSPAELAMDETEQDLVTGTRTKSYEIRSGLINRLNLLRNKSPPTTQPDHAGIFGRITGTNTGPEQCLTECMPHVCDDCAKDPRSPSVDWIG